MLVEYENNEKETSLFICLFIGSFTICELAVEKTLKQRSHGSVMLFRVQSTDIYIYHLAQDRLLSFLAFSTFF